MKNKIHRALLFINGSPPAYFPDFSHYSLIGCTDGAFNYLTNNHQSLLDFILGDLDSIHNTKHSNSLKLIIRKNQNKTDFEKALDYLIQNKINQVDVFGATGLEHDHFLGNISIAMKFFKTIQITFFDSYGRFFFTKKNKYYQVKKGVNVSLIPIKKVKKITTYGLMYSLRKQDLEFGKRIGIRNQATEEEIKINFKKGKLLLFIGN